jgi:hypothetical protein
MPIHNVAVFCASASGADPAYQTAANDLGRALAAHHVGVIYGGAKVGLMCAIAVSTLAHGGRVVGVIPEVLVDLEVAHNGVTELHVVDTMHTRKALMGEKADAFVIMPGGFGTLEEMFEVVTWQTLKLHNKPIVLLNVLGFYDQLLGFLDHAVAQGMLKQKNRDLLLVVDSVNEVMRALGISA